MSKTGAKPSPSADDLTLARDAAIECVNAAEEYYNAVCLVPRTDPEWMAPGIDKADLQKYEDAIEQKHLRLEAAWAAFDRLPPSILDFLDAFSVRDDVAPVALSGHRTARSLAHELAPAHEHFEIPSGLPIDALDRFVTLSRWQRVRQVLQPGTLHARRWPVLIDRIRQEHSKALACLVSEDAAGAGKRTKGLTEERLAKALLLLKKGPTRSYRSVAAEVGVSASTLWRNECYRRAKRMEQGQPAKGHIKSFPGGGPTDVEAYSSDHDPAKTEFGNL